MSLIKYPVYISGKAKDIHFNAFVNGVGVACLTGLALFAL